MLLLYLRKMIEEGGNRYGYVHGVTYINVNLFLSLPLSYSLPLSDSLPLPLAYFASLFIFLACLCIPFTSLISSHLIPIHPALCLPAYLPAYLSVCLSVCLTIFVDVSACHIINFIFIICLFSCFSHPTCCPLPLSKTYLSSSSSSTAPSLLTSFFHNNIFTTLHRTL